MAGLPGKRIANILEARLEVVGLVASLCLFKRWHSYREV